MKILNLYAGIGGNRKLWGDEHEIVAVELDPKIAAIYQELFPNDKVIVTDAHQYLLEHYKEFDFIWSSPPCPTHSTLQNLIRVQRPEYDKYPDMALYQEIIYLKHWFKGKYCIENVISYYEPLVKPQELENHYFWANFIIQPLNTKSIREHHAPIDKLEERKGFNLEKYKGIDKRKALRNCVEPETGLHILQCALGLNRQKPLL